jgi:hypothetical protein
MVAYIISLFTLKLNKMTYQERAKELIEKFNNIYPNKDWTDIALNSIDEVIKGSTDILFIEYWNNVKEIIINK